MQTTNSVLINQAKESLNGKWGLAIGGFLAYYLISTSLTFIPKGGILSVLIIGGPFLLGLQRFFLSIARNQEVKIDEVFSGFNSFGKALGAYLLMLLYIVLWCFLLIVPGIIAAFSYSMTFFILADEPSIGISEALNKSKQMMNGNKWKYFLLMLPFMVIPFILLMVYLSFIAVASFNHDYVSVLKYSSINNTVSGKLISSSIYVLLSWLFVWMYVASAKFYDDINPKEIETALDY